MLIVEEYIVALLKNTCLVQKAALVIRRISNIHQLKENLKSLFRFNCGQLRLSKAWNKFLLDPRMISLTLIVINWYESFKINNFVQFVSCIGLGKSFRSNSNVERSQLQKLFHSLVLKTSITHNLMIIASQIGI